jgi:hypothetical protein
MSPKSVTTHSQTVTKIRHTPNAKRGFIAWDRLVLSPTATEFCIDRSDPYYHEWRIALFHVAEKTGATAVREYTMNGRDAVYFTFNVPLPIAAIVSVFRWLVE